MSPTLQASRPAGRSFGVSLLLHSALIGLAIAWTPKVIEVVRTYEVELVTVRPVFSLTTEPPPAPKQTGPLPSPPEPQQKIPPPPKPEPVVIATVAKPTPAAAAQLPAVASVVQSPLRIAVASAPAPAPVAAAHTNTSSAAATASGVEEVSDPAYINSVRASVARHLRYPELALRRGTEGRIVLRLTLDARGKLLASTAHEPADNNALLGAALAAVRRAAPFPPWQGVHDPAATLNLTLPIRFKLEER